MEKFIEIIKESKKALPIIMLTALSEPEDRVKGLEAGAKDYLTKPFNVEELQLRLAAMLRRVNIQVIEEDQSVYHLGDYVYDTLNFNLKHPAFEKHLTKKEAQILKILCKFKNI